MKKAYEPVKRNIVAKGKATSVSIEKIYWDAIEQFASGVNETPLNILNRIIATQPANHKDRAAWIRCGVVTFYFNAFKRYGKAADLKSK